MSASYQKIMMDRKKGLYLKETPGKGRGVFCTSDIKKGETLEMTPAILLDAKGTKDADKTILADYTFQTGHLSKRVRERAKINKTDTCTSVIMGIASYCNHSKKPNAEILWEEIEGGLYYSLKATQAIPKNTEICTTYGGTWFKDRSKSSVS